MNILEKQLDYLNETMKETADGANSFLLKYHFGGLIAIIALLNADLVLANKIVNINEDNYRLIGGAVFLIFSLSVTYFYIVLMHYRRFSRSHRKLKYKYELTLHCSLTQGENRDYQLYLEKSIGDAPSEQQVDILKDHEGKNYKFTEVACYLLNHHRIKYQKLERVDFKYLVMALSVLALTLSIRGMFIVIDGGG